MCLEAGADEIRLALGLDEVGSQVRGKAGILGHARRGIELGDGLEFDGIDIAEEMDEFFLRGA